MVVEINDEFGSEPVFTDLSRVPMIGEELSGGRVVTRVIHLAPSRRGMNVVARIYVRTIR
jgi:hypothetical protein